MSRGITAGLLTLNLGLAAVLAVLWLAPGAPAQWRTWQAPAPQPPSLDDIDAARLTPNPAAGAAYPAVLQRPLMDPGRRPQAGAGAPGTAASAASAASASPPAAIEKVRLLGIVAGSALSGVLIDEDGQSRFLQRGERVGGWTLDSLQDRAAVFQRDGQQRRIELTSAQGDAPAAPGNARAAATPPAAPGNARAAAIPPARPAVAATPPAPAPAPAPAAAPQRAPAADAPAADTPAPPRGSFGGGRAARAVSSPPAAP